MRSFEFDAPILAAEQGSGGAYIEFPYDCSEAFGTNGRVKVACRFDGVAYRGSLVRMGSACHIVGIPKAIRVQLGKGPGDTVHVSLAEDLEERVVALHPRLAQVLDRDPKAAKTYEALSYTRRREINRSLLVAKAKATLERRLAQALAGLR